MTCLVARHARHADLSEPPLVYTCAGHAGFGKVYDLPSKPTCPRGTATGPGWQAMCTAVRGVQSPLVVASSKKCENTLVCPIFIC